MNLHTYIAKRNTIIAYLEVWHNMGNVTFIEVNEINFNCFQVEVCGGGGGGDYEGVLIGFLIAKAAMGGRAAADAPEDGAVPADSGSPSEPLALGGLGNLGGGLGGGLGQSNSLSNLISQLSAQKAAAVVTTTKATTTTKTTTTKPTTTTTTKATTTKKAGLFWG